MSDSQITKRAIAATFIELCSIKEYSKISIQDITKKVGLNRQTFYYHFADKQDLLRWIYRNDSLHYLTDPILSIENWEEQVLKMLKMMKEKEAFYYTTVNSNSDVLRECLSSSTKVLFVQLFEEIDIEKQLFKKDKEFYGDFFSYGCSGVLIHWILSNYKESPLEVATQLFRLAKDVEFFSYRLYLRESD